MPGSRVSPKGMIASAATAVSIEIAGARAIIQGTAVRGEEDSLERSFSTSARGWISP